MRKFISHNTYYGNKTPLKGFLVARKTHIIAQFLHKFLFHCFLFSICHFHLPFPFSISISHFPCPIFRIQFPK